MGRKTRAVKSKHSNSIPPSNPSPISSPLRYQDEPNEENHLDSKDHGALENNGSRQHNHNNDGNVDGNIDVCLDDDVEEEKDNDNGNDGNVDGNDDVCVDDDVEEEKDNDNGNNVEVPDSVVEVDRHAGGNHVAGPSGSKDCIVLDWLEGEFCIRCSRRSGQVLICSENGCPVAIHEVCMNCEPKFDDIGKFYCPYCCYKRELARTKELRRKAMLAKQELSNFMCLRRDGGNEGKKEEETLNMKRASASTMAGKVNSGDCEDRLNDDDAKEPIQHNHDQTQGVESISKEKSDEASISRAQGFDDVCNGEWTQEEDIENSSENEDNVIDEDQCQIQPSGSSHLGIMEATLRVSTRETSDDAGVLEENKRKRGKEEPMLPNAVGTNMALFSRDTTSKVPAIESFEFVSPNLDTETLILHQKRVKQAAQKARPQDVDSPNNPSLQPSTSAKDMKMNQEGKTTAKYSVQCQESTKHLKVPTVGPEKRRRLHWTAEEEDMLKEGVNRFSSKVNRNIPWRKILEYGHHVFHATRTPVDLKDKWKNIMAKKSPKSNMGY